MKIAIGADCYGYPAKHAIISRLKAEGHEIVDVGTHMEEPDEKILDYADAVSHAVSSGTAERGILLCMSGGLMCIRANRWPGVRALVAFRNMELIHDREASDINVLCLPAYYTSAHLLDSLLKTFMKTPFDPLERRIKRLAALDRPCTVPTK